MVEELLRSLAIQPDLLALIRTISTTMGREYDARTSHSLQWLVISFY